MRKQPERTAKTKQALINAFWSYYETTPIEKITIRQITESAGVYRSTFYEYFSEVYAVRDEIEDSMIASYESLISKVPEIRSLSDAMELIVEFYSLNAKYLAVLLGPHGDAEFISKIKSMISQKLQPFLNISDNDRELDILIEIAASIVISTLNYWHIHREEITVEEVLSTSGRFLQNGLKPFFESRGLRPLD